VLQHAERRDVGDKRLNVGFGMRQFSYILPTFSRG
jgi:hypothetical protein